jgi:hypothetical protein
MFNYFCNKYVVDELNYIYRIVAGIFFETKNLPALPSGRQAVCRDNFNGKRENKNNV